MFTFLNDKWTIFDTTVLAHNLIEITNILKLHFFISAANISRPELPRNTVLQIPVKDNSEYAFQQIYL